MARTAFNHVGQEQVCQAHGRQQVDLHQRFPPVPGHEVDTPCDGHTGVVDKDIRGELPRPQLGDELPRPIRQRQVAGNNSLNAPAALLGVGNVGDKSVECRSLDIRHDKAAAEVQQLIDKVAPEAAGSAGHDNQRVGKICHGDCCCQWGLR